MRTHTIFLNNPLQLVVKPREILYQDHPKKRMENCCMEIPSKSIRLHWLPNK